MHAYIYFYPAGWDTSPHGSLEFVFHNHTHALDLDIELRWADEAARGRLFDVVRRYESLFIRFVENPGTRLNPTLYRRNFLTPKLYEEANDSEREEEIRRRWTEFLEEDLPRIGEVLKKAYAELWRVTDGARTSDLLLSHNPITQLSLGVAKSQYCSYISLILDFVTFGKGAGRQRLSASVVSRLVSTPFRHVSLARPTCGTTTLVITSSEGERRTALLVIAIAHGQSVKNHQPKLQIECGE